MNTSRFFLFLGLASAVLFSGCNERQLPPENEKDIRQTVRLLMREDTRLTDLPFAELVEAATSCRVLPWDSEDPICQYVGEKIAAAATSVRKSLNASDHPSRSAKRINEVSIFAEKELRALLDADPLLDCGIPRNSEGKERRSGYPDLVITHKPSGRTVYLDPKLYAAQQAAGSFRSFYYQPSVKTNKIQRDAHHLVIGFSHETAEEARRFIRWILIDLHEMNIDLKAEFHASNKEMYRADHVVQSEEESE